MGGGADGGGGGEVEARAHQPLAQQHVGLSHVSLVGRAGLERDVAPAPARLARELLHRQERQLHLQQQHLDALHCLHALHRLHALGCLAAAAAAAAAAR